MPSDRQLGSSPRRAVREPKAVMWTYTCLPPLLLPLDTHHLGRHLLPIIYHHSGCVFLSPLSAQFLEQGSRSRNIFWLIQ